jgi:excisionase family DNA binding protein
MPSQVHASASRASAPTLSTVEAARRLDINPRTLKRWIEDGIFPRPLSAGPRRRWRFDPATIDAWLSEHGSVAARAPLDDNASTNPAVPLLDALLVDLAAQTKYPPLALWARRLLAAENGGFA